MNIGEEKKKQERGEAKCKRFLTTENKLWVDRGR